ncbi:MAG: helix-turn-helix domain-containing protein [candidate division KSB1 bacterium]|nr:helix-turn-helix domain-containing protein [candidate division KSB1 bacterium]
MPKQLFYMTVDFLDILLFVLFFQLLSFVPFLSIEYKKRNHANLFLALFLGAKALCISNMLAFRHYDFFFQHFPHLFIFGSSFTILWGPLLYLYTRALVFKEHRMRKTDALHFVPFLLHFTYLNPDLTFEHLSEMTHIPLRSLSEVLNRTLNQNFYEFINSYRIQEAISMFSDPSARHSTILETLYSVGFNSKSSFNHFFKKSTGMTPSQYRRLSKA